MKSNSNIKPEIIIDEHNAKYVKRAFELYATGMYSYKTLGDKLYLEGFRHPKTGEKYPARKFEWMLHNIFYIGKFKWGGEIYEGNHDAIISPELYYRVQDMFKDIDRTKKHTVTFAYTNLIKCAECGCYLTAEFKRGKNKKGHYVYYHWSNAKGVHENLKNYREEYFDNTFAAILDTICLEAEEIERLKILAKDYIKEFSEYESNIRKDITKRIDTLSNLIKKSYIAKLNGDIPAGMTEDDVNNLHKEWQEEKDRLVIKLSNTNASSKFIYERMNQLLKFSEMLPHLFLKATAEEKKLIVTTMTKSVKFDGNNIIVELKDTFKVFVS